MSSLRSHSRPHVHRLGIATCVVVLSTSSCFAQETAATWKKDLSKWRADHVSELKKPDGWLSLAGLEWLQSGDNSVGSAADNKIHIPASGPAHLANLHLENDTLKLLPPIGEFPPEFLIAGVPAKEQVIPVEKDTDKKALHLTVGTLNMYVIRREDRFALRVKDSHAPALVNFHGLKWFAPNISYRVNAKWIPFNPPKSVTLETLAGTKHDLPGPGVAEFILNGKTYRLEPVLEDPKFPKLFFILRDTTSATTTYPACRFLYTVLPINGLDKPGELLLDFNRLENPPCAYTSFSTCPLPPPVNKLPIALPVGEQRYHE